MQNVPRQSLSPLANLCRCSYSVKRLISTTVSGYDNSNIPPILISDDVENKIHKDYKISDERSSTSNENSLSSPLSPDMPKFYQNLNNELRKYHGLMPLKNYHDLSDDPTLSSILGMSDGNAKDEDTEKTSALQRQIQINKSNLYIGSILEVLASMRTALSSTNNEMILERKHTSKPLPKFPLHWSKEQLISYLKSITGYHHTNPDYSSPNGLISSIIKDLLRVNNPNTMTYLSTEAFNIGIAYQVRNNDLRSSRQLFQDMLSSGISVNTDTYNILLIACRYRLGNINDSWKMHPLRVIDGYLKQMRSKGIPANIDTWNIVLSTIPEGSNKARVLTEMSKKNVPLSKRGLATCVRDIVNQVGPKLTMLYLDKQFEKYDVGIDTVNTVISGLLNDDKNDKILSLESADVAWKYLHYALGKWNLTPTTSVLNTFCQCFARHGKINWLIGIYTAMISHSKWNINPSCITYQYMIEAAVRAPFHPSKYELIEILYSISSRVSRTKASQNWISRSKTQFQYYNSESMLSKNTFNLTKKITPEVSLLWNQIQYILKWNDQSINPNYMNEISPNTMLAKLLNLFPTENPEYDHKLHTKKSRKFYHQTTKTFQSQKSKKEVINKQQLIDTGPYQKYIDDLAKEGLIDR